jgi:hypothetical protein
VADFSGIWINNTYNECNMMLSLMTVEEREHMYMRKEKMLVLEAKEFIKCGVPKHE